MVATANAVPRQNKVKLPYYNFDKLMSYNGTYNFVCGGRGLGKTYGAKYKCIKDAITRGEQFVYMRRYKDEIKASRNSFFADIFHEFPEYDFRTNGELAQMSPVSLRDEKKRPWETIGYFLALSTAGNLKSVSYPLVTKIVYDEFILEKGMTHYLPNEEKAFNQFYSTVDRWKDKTRVFFLANAVSIMTPFFLAYNIKPDEESEWVRRKFIRTPDGGKRNFIVCHFPDSEDFQQEAYKTAFGQFIESTEYADFALGNEFADDHDGLIAAKTSNADYQYTLETIHGTFSVWLDFDQSPPIWYILERRPKNELLYTLIPERMDDDKYLMTYNDKLLQLLRTAFKQRRAYFDTSKSRNAFAEIAKR